MVVASLDHLTGPSFQGLPHLFLWPELLNTKENWVKMSQCLNPSVYCFLIGFPCEIEDLLYWTRCLGKAHIYACVFLSFLSWRVFNWGSFLQRRAEEVLFKSRILTGRKRGCVACRLEYDSKRDKFERDQMGIWREIALIQSVFYSCRLKLFSKDSSAWSKILGTTTSARPEGLQNCISHSRRPRHWCFPSVCLRLRHWAVTCS